MQIPLSEVVWWTALLAGLLYVWMRGGRPERITAAVLFLGGVLDVVVYSRSWDRFHIAPAVIEAAVLVTLLWLALTTDRWWPTAAVSFQIIAALVRYVPIFDPWTRPLAAYIGVVGWDYLTLGALVIGTALEASPFLAKDAHHA